MMPVRFGLQATTTGYSAPLQLKYQQQNPRSCSNFLNSTLLPKIKTERSITSAYVFGSCLEFCFEATNADNDRNQLSIVPSFRMPSGALG
eukprot:scaffold4062_cov137-Cylindrotheca_fusiformis.AAC.11